MQSKKQSFIEATVNVLVGYWVAVLSQAAIYPFFAIRTTAQENLVIAFWFTCVSLLRSYLLRRAFNFALNRKFKKV